MKPSHDALGSTLTVAALLVIPVPTNADIAKLLAAMVLMKDFIVIR